MKKVFIILPSPHPTGPIKGAVALANKIVQYYPTTLVYLKKGPGVDAQIDTAITVISLTKANSLLKNIQAYQKLLSNNGRRHAIFSISFCFSADLVNLCCYRKAVICSSIRGNLTKNYQFEFGSIGYVFAALHLFVLRWFDHAIAMNITMADQIKQYSGKTAHIVGNFVDEIILDDFRLKKKNHSGPYRFIFVGRLTKLKQIPALLDAAERLKSQGHLFHLDIIGDGELMPELAQSANQLHIVDRITFHGHLKSPYALMSQADCLILPSFTEGVSRAVLEALYLGVPCLVRNIDGNSELIKNGKNGYLFDTDTDLSELMIKTATLSRQSYYAKETFLPDGYRQEPNSQKLIELINGRS